jgi:hypothetical protein
MIQSKQRWNVALLGARMHYAVPRLLYQSGLLEHFYTDICAVKGWPALLQALPKSLQTNGIKRLLGRVPQGIPADHITAFNPLGWEYSRRLRQATSPAETLAAFLWSGQTFCELILKEGLGNASGIFTFNTAGLELLQEARDQGLQTVTEQTVAPREIEQRLILEEQEKFPDWEIPLPTAGQWVAELAARERAEWGLADMVICGSEFVREGVIACGGSPSQCQVVPYGVDLRFSLPERSPHEGPLRVLTVGGVGLRKGSPYVLAAAQSLQGKAVFRLVGPLGVEPAARSLLEAHLELMGPVPRSEILAQYAWGDVFLLPSICEGSATVIYEALAAGLPVICTPNAGSVVRDGVDGFIVPIRDPGAIIEKVEQLTTNPELLAEMSQNARRRAWEYSIDAYGERLKEVLLSLN